MTWTHEAPSGEGWYWWRTSPCSEPMVVDVYNTEHSPQIWMVRLHEPLCGFTVKELQLAYPRCQWSSTRILQPQ